MKVPACLIHLVFVVQLQLWWFLQHIFLLTATSTYESIRSPQTESIFMDDKKKCKLLKKKIIIYCSHLISTHIVPHSVTAAKAAGFLQERLVWQSISSCRSDNLISLQ